MTIDIPQLVVHAFTSATSAGVRPWVRARIVASSFQSGAYAKARIVEAQDIPCTGRIVRSAIAAPTSALALHLGSGVVQILWQHENQEAVDYYIVQVASSLSGAYQSLSESNAYTTHLTIHNLPIGQALYFRVCAIGKNKLPSDWTQVKLGKKQSIQASLLVTSLSGSIVKKGAMFHCKDKSGQSMMTATCLADFVVE